MIDGHGSTIRSFTVAGISRRVVVAIILATALPLFLYRALDAYSETDRLLAWIVFGLASMPAFRMLVSGDDWPILPLVGAQYAVLYAIPVFTEASIRIGGQEIVPSEIAIRETLLLVAVALCSVFLGYFGARRFLHVRFHLVLFETPRVALFRFGICLSIFGMAAPVLFRHVPSGLVAPLGLALSPFLGWSILACMYHARLLFAGQQIASLFVIAAAVALGFLGGTLTNAVLPIVIWVLARWTLQRRPPIVPAIVLAGIFFLIQPIKGAYRAAVWLNETPPSLVERAALLGQLTSVYWQSQAAQLSNAADVGRDLAAQRLSLLMTTAHYVEATPQEVPYQGPRTLLYPVYGWLPRALWPDKPIAQQANKVLPVAYGLQDASTLDLTMFGVGHVAEVYTALGLVGIIPVFVGLGVLYVLPELILRSGPRIPALAVFIAVVGTMMNVGTTIGDSFGGFVQQILVQVAILRFVIGRTPTVTSEPSPLPPTASQ